MDNRGRKADPIVGDGFNVEIARRIRGRREDLKLSVEDAAARTGGVVQPATWYQIERGRMPKLASALAICAALRYKLTAMLPERASRLVGGPAVGCEYVREACN